MRNKTTSGSSKPLYPHVPKRREPLYPHGPKSQQVDLRGDYDEKAEVSGGTLYRKSNVVQVWWSDGTKETWTSDEANARKNFQDMKERWSTQSTKEQEPNIDQIVADLNLLREERVWIDTFRTKGASVIHIQTGDTATITSPPEDFTSPNYADRAMQIKWADGSEMVVDSNDFAPSSLQKQIAEITHGKPIPKFPEPRENPGKKPFIKVGERVRFIGSSRYRYETWPEGKWLEYGVTGTVTEYHPEHPAVRVGGEYFEAIPPYAVVRWDLGGAADTAIDPTDEGERWERILTKNSSGAIL